MKQITRFTLLMSLLMALFITSCGSDTETPTPADPRDAWIGIYTLNETYIINGVARTATYDISITKGTGSSEVLIGNFGDFGIIVSATVLSSSLSIDAARIYDIGGGTLYKFLGSFTTSTLTFSYEGFLASNSVRQITASGPYTKK